jgi:pyrimidine operon attenuation protein/uracil phosphoribosyltransferase
MKTQKVAQDGGLRLKSQLLSASDVERSLVRLAYQVVEENGVENLGLIGIRRRGVPMAERIREIIQGMEKKPVPVGTLDITFYRDDLSTVGPRPVVKELELGFPIQDMNIVLVDDVLPPHGLGSGDRRQRIESLLHSPRFRHPCSAAVLSGHSSLAGDQEGH